MSNTEFPPLKNDLILRVARGEKNVERVPVWCHRQAGRYLPEFREVRKTAEFFDLCRNPELACEVTLQPLRRFELDAAIIFSDILVVPQALGMEVEMIKGKGPSFPNPLRELSDLDRLHTFEQTNVKESLKYVYDAITLTRHKLEGKVPLIGFSGAPWTLMAYMIEGGGAKSYNRPRSWMYKHPQETHKLLQLLTDVIVEHLYYQVKAGAQMLEVFDSWAGDLSCKMFLSFSLPYLTQIATNVKAKLRADGMEPVPITCFAKGASFALNELSLTEFDVLAVDWSVKPSEVSHTNLKLRSKVRVQGNLDPSVLYASKETILSETKAMIDNFGTQGYIANLGHGMLPDHDPDQLRIFIDEVHRYSEELNKKKGGKRGPPPPYSPPGAGDENTSAKKTKI